MRHVIDTVLDRNDSFEIMPDYAKNILTCFGEIGGKTVGIVAN